MTRLAPRTYDHRIREQIALAGEAETLARRGIPVLISNHDTLFTRDIYSSAKILSFLVQRYISCKGEKRQKVKELLAIYRSRK